MAMLNNQMVYGFLTVYTMYHYIYLHIYIYSYCGCYLIYTFFYGGYIMIYPMNGYTTYPTIDCIFWLMAETIGI